MKSVIAFAASGLCGAAMAFPEVSDVSMTQDANRLVTITYALSEPAVVTFDILTNNTVSGKWESIGVERFDHATGDAGKLVAAGVGKSIVWQPRYDWPGQKITGGNVKCEVKAWPTNAPPPFMAVSLCNENEVRYYASEAAVPGGVIVSDAGTLDLCGETVSVGKIAASGLVRNGSLIVTDAIAAVDARSILAVDGDLTLAAGSAVDFDGYAVVPTGWTPVAAAGGTVTVPASLRARNAAAFNSCKIQLMDGVLYVKPSASGTIISFR